MGIRTNKLAIRALGILLLLSVFISAGPTIVTAQMQQYQQQWQEEQARQMYARQQWLQWQNQEQMRQMSDRQQWLQWQQQEKIRQMYQR
jgi:hypothetical protein